MKLTQAPIPLLLLLLIDLALFGQKPATAVEPSWITHTTIDYNNAKIPGEAKDGYSYLALERQVNIASHTVYHKTVLKIITAAGIQNASQVSVSYDPSYQHIFFHSIQIIRDGVAINKLNLGKVKTIQQETELDRSIYNGTVTAVLFLEDVRKGDQIEYAYSVQGVNPVFRDKYSTEFQTQFGAPIGRLLCRIVCPGRQAIPGEEQGYRPAAGDYTAGEGQSISMGIQ